MSLSYDIRHHITKYLSDEDFEMYLKCDPIFAFYGDKGYDFDRPVGTEFLMRVPVRMRSLFTNIVMRPGSVQLEKYDPGSIHRFEYSGCISDPFIGTFLGMMPMLRDLTISARSPTCKLPIHVRNITLTVPEICQLTNAPELVALRYLCINGYYMVETHLIPGLEELTIRTRTVFKDTKFQIPQSIEKLRFEIRMLAPVEKYLNLSPLVKLKVLSIWARERLTIRNIPDGVKELILDGVIVESRIPDGLDIVILVSCEIPDQEIDTACINSDIPVRFSKRARIVECRYRTDDWGTKLMGHKELQAIHTMGGWPKTSVCEEVNLSLGALHTDICAEEHVKYITISGLKCLEMGITFCGSPIVFDLNKIATRGLKMPKTVQKLYITDCYMDDELDLTELDSLETFYILANTADSPRKIHLSPARKVRYMILVSIGPLTVYNVPDDVIIYKKSDQVLLK